VCNAADEDFTKQVAMTRYAPARTGRVIEAPAPAVDRSRPRSASSRNSRGRIETRRATRSARRTRPRRSLANRFKSVGNRFYLNPRRVHPDSVDASARGDVQRLLIGIAETHIGGLFRRSQKKHVG
jgi:hypothetical protein